MDTEFHQPTSSAIYNYQPHIYALTVVTLTVFIFFVLNELTIRLVPKNVKSQWKFKNIFLSLLHAGASGIWALWSLLNLPEMAKDVINVYDGYAYTLVCFSLGYVIYDSIDMITKHRKRESYELLGHHAVIFVCFGVAILKRMYVGYAVVALTVEINSIFLHIRQLMLICRVDKSNKLYRLNSLANIATFITFRIMTFGWMTRWLFLNKDLVPLVSFTIGSVGLAIMTMMNIILFYRLLKSDFFHTIHGDNKIE